MPDRTVILIPPSEGKATGGEGPPWAPATMTLPDLDRARARVLRAVRGRPSPRSAATMPAIERYTGVLYRELDAASLGAPARRRLDRSLRIASGLWGLVAPPDPIPAYRLKMSASLPPMGRLSTWWRPQLTEALAPSVRGAVVWDLLPQEHAAAIDWTGLDPRQRATVRFLDAEGRTVSHWNKLLKGSLVRWLVTSGATTLDELATFDHPLGYRLDPVATIADGAHVTLTFRAA